MLTKATHAINTLHNITIQMLLYVYIYIRGIYWHKKTNCTVLHTWFGQHYDPGFNLNLTTHLQYGLL